MVLFFPCIRSWLYCVTSYCTCFVLSRYFKYLHELDAGVPVTGRFAAKAVYQHIYYCVLSSGSDCTSQPGLMQDIVLSDQEIL